MRVLFITRKFPPSSGGMEIYSKQLYEALVDMGTDIHLHRPATDLIGRPSLRQVAGFFFSACWMLLRTGRQFDAILIGDYAIASLAMIAKLATFGKVRVVVSLHGNDLYFMRKRTLKARVYRAINRLVVVSGALDAAMANSHAIENEAKRRSIAPVTVVPLATVVPPEPLQEDIRRERMVVFTGRLIRYKGLSWFVDNVWPFVDPELELVVAGQVWDSPEFECLGRQPRITYLGVLPHGEVSLLRARAIASIMPNIPPAADEQDEGFGLVALEAPAVGTPTIASRCGGIPDAVADGITGFLLPPLDAAAWIRALNEVAHWSADHRDAFARAAREHVIEHFNWRLVAQRTLAVLEAR
jgi:phosphatidyl-myo-inositol dimannoside synthase